MKYYAGIGSRKTPPEILEAMTQIARWLDSQGWILRSGGADGADSAFEAGATHKEIFYAKDATPAGMEVAKKYHPAWDKMGDYAKRLHGRNSLQILGRDLQTPVKFVICWTPDGCTSHKTRSIRTGGTGTAISIASSADIQVFNLENPEVLRRIMGKFS